MWVAHFKEYKYHLKRELRGGDVITGRVIGNVPTAYEVGDISQNQDDLNRKGITADQAKTTKFLETQSDELRRKGKEFGTNSMDGNFREKRKAEEAGGPYDHEHQSGSRVPDMYLAAHLQYAHGIESPLKSVDLVDLKQMHDELHAAARLAAKITERENDKGWNLPAEADWRDQSVIEVGQAPKVSDSTDLNRIEEK